MHLSRRGLIKTSATTIVLASLGSAVLQAADVLVLHEGDAECRAWLAALPWGTSGRIELRQVALLERGALARTAEWLDSQSQRRLLALVGNGEAVALEALLRQTGAQAVAVLRHGQRVQIDARL